MRVEVVIDINDPQVMIPFYQNLLGYRSNEADNERYSIDQTYYSLLDTAGNGPKLIFQVVPEPVSSKKSNSPRSSCTRC